MTTTADLYNSISDAGALFNVRRERMFSESGALSSKMGIINEATNEVIGIVSENYKVVTNEEVIKSMLGAFDAAKTDLTDARVSVKSNRGGSRTLVDIILPAYNIMEGTNKTELRISTLNSYDGCWRYMSKAGGIRVACLNGNIFGKIVSSYSEYHNSKLDVQIGADRMSKMIGEFSGAEDWFTTLISRPVDGFDVEQMACKFFGKTAAELETYKPYTAHFKLIVDAYFTEMGQNAYSLYNAFTDYISHKKRSDNAQASSLVYAETQLGLILDSNKAFAR
jgi:hypothetical protein